jgi:small multidrug resistance pump
MHWIILGISIVAEVIATSALKASEGFTRLVPSIVVVVGYSVAFYLLSQALSRIPLGIAYAIWSGAGIVLVSIVGYLRFGEKLDVAALAGIGLIMAGVLVINLISESVGH